MVLNNKGFTLMELVLVIVLLGIITAIALPRFSNIKEDAEKATAVSMARAFEAAINLAHYQWRTNDEPATVTVEGKSITMNSSGWPQPTSQAECIGLWNDLLQTPPTMDVYLSSTPADEWSALGSSINCLFFYQNKKKLTIGETAFFSYHPQAWPASSPTPSFLGGEIRVFNMD